MSVAIDVKTRRFSYGHFCFCLFVLFVLVLSSAKVLAQASDRRETNNGFAASSASNLSPELAALAGQWDLTPESSAMRTGEGRTCRLTLSLKPAGEQGFALLAPSSCRKSLPIIARLTSWDPITRRRIDFTDQHGAAILIFFAKENRGFLAVGPEGESYQLTEVTLGPPAEPSIDPQAVSATSRAVQTPEKMASAQAPHSLPSTAIGSIKLTDLPGRYAILRDGRDTGCMITLDRGSYGGNDRVILAPACRDHGIVIFDPVSWQLSRGRIILTARKGHVMHLDLQADGTWTKDPSEGKSLGLKKL